MVKTKKLSLTQKIGLSAAGAAMFFGAGAPTYAMGSKPQETPKESSYVIRVADGAVGELRGKLGSDEEYFTFGTDFPKFMHNLAFPGPLHRQMRKFLQPFKTGFSEGKFDKYGGQKGIEADLNDDGYLSSTEIGRATGMDAWTVNYGMREIERMIEQAMKNGGGSGGGSSSSSSSSSGNGSGNI